MILDDIEVLIDLNCSSCKEDGCNLGDKIKELINVNTSVESIDIDDFFETNKGQINLFGELNL